MFESAEIGHELGKAEFRKEEPKVRQRLLELQTRLGREARAKNVAGAFAMTPGAAELDPERPVILVDDVVTTGATLGAAARVLSAAGIRRVLALTAAREL